MSPLHQCIDIPIAYGSNYTITFTLYRDSLGQLWETVITPCMEVAVYHSGGFVIDVSYTSVSFLLGMPLRMQTNFFRQHLLLCLFNFLSEYHCMMNLVHYYKDPEFTSDSLL